MPKTARETAAINLPPGVQMFTISQLAKIFSSSDQHWIAQVESGQLFALDLRSPGATKAMLRIPRPALVAFLEKRATVELAVSS
jgi:hypothetical protein